MTFATTTMRYVSFFVATLYLVVGVIVLWKSNELISIPSNRAVPLGILLMAYGLFRGYRAYQRHLGR